MTFGQRNASAFSVHALSGGEFVGGWVANGILSWSYCQVLEQDVQLQCVRHVKYYRSIIGNGMCYKVLQATKSSTSSWAWN